MPQAFRCLVFIGILLACISWSGAVFSEELIVKPCQELLRMAETYQEDLRTVDTVLGSALEVGNMDKIKNYQLKKSAIKKQLDSVIKAIELKGCVKSR